jgi:hypothetical protein
MTSPARRLWSAAETLHAVSYFHPAALAALSDAGARGFWMGYFAGRLGPLGPVGPGVGTAVCFNFAPARVARALPDAWSFVAPADAVAARTRGAAAALGECGVGVPGDEVLGTLDRLVAGLDPAGRPLAAANLDLPVPDDGLQHLWQTCTVLREHRGDAHVALLVGAGLDGCEANVLATAVSGLDPAVLRDSRAWTAEQWRDAQGRLLGEGILAGDGSTTEDGARLHADIEHRTDALALESYRAVLTEDELEGLTRGLRDLARAVLRSGALPFPNPIGLGDPGDGDRPSA